MRSHAWRPLWVILGVLAVFLIVREIYVPSDFTVHRGTYTYGWFRTGDVKDWENITVKHKTREYCKECHADNYRRIMASKHARVQCENCHGPAKDHPMDPEKLEINRDRSLCLRCHGYLPYRPAVYAGLAGGPIPLKMQKGDEHNPGVECVTCHSVHDASFKEQ